MAKTKEENPSNEEMILDTTPVEEKETVIPAAAPAAKVEQARPAEEPAHEEVVNCLRNERIIVRHIPRQTGLVTNPKHVLYGGMSNNATRKFSVPRLSSGTYVNVLTKAEKDCLEEALGLEPNALSIHRKVNNFWDDSNPNGFAQVTLRKEDNYFDLSKPVEYIQYKILLANKNIICPSLRELQDCPKVTYQFVIINEGDEVKSAKMKMTSVQQCYKEFGKIEDDFDTLRVIVETITGRPIAKSTKIDFLQTQINELIQADSKMFLSIATDSYLKMKVLIKKATEAGIISYRGDQLYLREGNMPLCEYGEDSTLGNAAKYLANPKHQDVLFAIQAKLK